MPVPLSDDDISALLAYWVAQLPLADWTIKVRIVAGLELGRDHARAAVAEPKNVAVIRLRDPRDTDPDEAEVYDPEIALVHELLHVALAPFMDCPKDSHKDIRQEQTIHALSKSLVSMRRASNPRRRSAAHRLVVIPLQKAA